MRAKPYSLKDSAPEKPVVGSRPTTASDPDETGLQRRGREAAGLVLLAATVFLSLALASVRSDPHDPDVSGANWMGPVGATIAGWLVRGFGLIAWLIPVDLALIGAPLLAGRVRRALGLRVAGDLVVAILAAALLQVLSPDLFVFGHEPPGGNVGLLFGELMRGLFSTLGSVLVGATSVVLILIGRQTFSLVQAAQATWRLIQGKTSKLGDLLRKIVAAWSQASKLRKERREAARLAGLPVIDARPSDQAIIAELEDDESDWIPTDQETPLRLTVSASLAARAPMTLDTKSSAADNGARVIAASGTGGGSNASAEQTSLAPPTPPPRGNRAARAPRIVDTTEQSAVTREPREERRGTTSGFKLPPIELLQPAPPVITDVDRESLLQQAARLEKTLSDYGVSGRVEEIHPGPTVTTFEVAPEAGTKVSKVSNLTDDLALGLSRKVRIVAPIPGKNRIGFELPNDERCTVNLRELVEDKRFEKLAERAPLPVVLGRDIVGAPFYADLASLPHVIVAGATGAGKSVGLNVMLSSLLFRRTPDELRLLMIDPKVVELAPFDGIPHMLLPVVTDMKQAATALRWAVNEMERRYQLIANAGTKNIGTYNRWAKRVSAGELPRPAPEQVQALAPDGALVSVPAAKHGGDGTELPGTLPYIVLVVDEFADLMMQQGKEVEASVARLAQKARAAGIHVVLATQRPSVDVITGMIKANFPSRIAFRVAQRVDSRTILDEQGAELLLGRGDMLVKLNGSSDTRRVQCPFVSEEDVTALADHLRAQGAPTYHEAILTEPDQNGDGDEQEEQVDVRFDEAVRIVAETQRCSTSWLQRKMTIGYNRAAKMVELMEKRGLVGPANGARDREVLIGPDYA